MDTNEECKNIIILNSDSPKIYKPKPKKLCISYRCEKSTHNIKKNAHKKHYPLTPISNTNFNFKNSINNNCKSKKDLKSNAIKKPKLDFDDISLKEIEKDFSLLKAKSEVKKVEKELLYLLRNSTKDDSFDDECKETVKIKRPKKPFLENLE